MKIPFIEHIGIGLHITDFAVRWVALSRIGNRITIDEAKRQAVVDGDIPTALSELLAERKSSYNFVSVNISSALLERLVLDVPDFDDDYETNIWLEQARKKVIPEGYSQEQVVTTHHFFGNRGSGYKCLLIAVLRTTIEDRKKLLASVGLSPVVVTTADLGGRYAVMYDEEFNDSVVLYLNVFEDCVCLQQFQEGMLEHHIPFRSHDTVLSDRVEEVESMVAAQSNADSYDYPLYITASEKFGDMDLQSELVTIRKPLPLSHLNFGDRFGLLPDYTVACGMAVRQLYGGLDSIDFLNREERRQVESEIQKRDVAYTGAVLGIVVCVFWLLLFGLQSYIDHTAAEVSQTTSRLQEKITRVNLAQDKIAALRDRVSRTRQVMNRRTNTAEILEHTGRALPSGTWLSELSVEKNAETATGFNVLISGYSERETQVTRLLEKLEENKYLGKIRLLFTEQVSLEEVYDARRYKDKKLVHFKIQMQHNKKR